MLRIDIPLLLTHLVIYLIFMILFTRLAIRPFIAYLKQRDRGMNGLKEDNGRLRQQIDSLDRQFEDRMIATQEEANRQMESIKQNASEEERAIVDRARKEASDLLRKTEEELVKTTEQLKIDLNKKIGEITSAIVDKFKIIALFFLFIPFVETWASSNEHGTVDHPSITELIMPAINFLTLLVLLVWLLWKPISRFIEQRHAGMAEFLHTQKNDHLTLSRQLGELQSKLDRIETLSAGVINDKKDIAMAEYTATIDNARRVSGQIAENAAKMGNSLILRTRDRLLSECLEIALAEAGKTIAAKHYTGVEKMIGSESFQAMWR